VAILHFVEPIEVGRSWKWRNSGRPACGVGYEAF
jgi:hypothetical protein